MRRFVFAVVMLLGVAAMADDITTLDGKTYRNVKVTSSDPISITVSHSTGVGMLLFAEMDADLQKKYGYNAAKAAAYLDELKAKRAAQAGKQSTDYATPFVEETNAPSQDQPADQPTRKTTRAVTADTDDHSGEKATGETTRSGQTIYEGPRGGHYHYSASGNKVYERKKK
jgi:hypothetical protein